MLGGKKTLTDPENLSFGGYIRLLAYLIVFEERRHRLFLWYFHNGVSAHSSELGLRPRGQQMFLLRVALGMTVDLLCAARAPEPCAVLFAPLRCGQLVSKVLQSDC